jgi:hypothetical protein
MGTMDWAYDAIVKLPNTSTFRLQHNIPKCRSHYSRVFKKPPKGYLTPYSESVKLFFIIISARVIREMLWRIVSNTSHRRHLGHQSTE